MDGVAVLSKSAKIYISLNCVYDVEDKKVRGVWTNVGKEGGEE